MTVSDLANFLLDDTSAVSRRCQLDLFKDLDQTILSTFDKTQPAPVAEALPVANGSYVVASRLGRTNYEANAKKEAISKALQAMRGNRGLGNGRVIRSS
jgi:hypothetical protein